MAGRQATEEQGRTRDGAGANGGRRRRRSRDDIANRITEAARQLFATRGHHGTTTREIARVADVSETLLFRYFGSKPALFDEVVAQPFARIMEDFVEEPAQDRRAAEHRNVARVYSLFEDNRALFLAVLANSGPVEDEDSAPSFSGIATFLDAATEQQLEKYRIRGEEPPFDIRLAMRLAFGMLASSVLMKDWLFSDLKPCDEEVISLVEAVVNRAMDPSEP